MKVHTTNYIDTFIQVADDCPAINGQIPPVKEDKKTVANIQYEMISQHPYNFTSDEVLFQIFALKNDLSESEKSKAKEQFFSKGQPCLRSSPLAKRYGWGVHSNNESKIAIHAVESDKYKKLSADKKIKQLKAMRSEKK